MEQQPAFQPGSEEGPARQERALNLLKQLGKILAAGVAGAVVYTLIIGPRSLVGFSNGLFLAGAILLFVSLLPLLSEVVGRATISFRVKEEGFEDVMAKQRERGRQGEKTTFLFGLAGVITVILSFLLAFI